MDQKNWTKTILTTCALILIIGASVFYLWERQKQNIPNPSPTPTINFTQITAPIILDTSPTATGSVIASPAADPSAWRTYSNTAFALQYPPMLLTKENKETLILSHAIPYKHINPCDEKGGAPDLENITDFKVSLVVSNKNLKQAIEGTEGSTYIVDSFFENNTLKISPGFIDTFNAGSLKGFQITSGVEGCGRFTYYFPVNENKTAIIIRNFIPEFNSISGNSQIYLKLPGIIPPDQEKKFFDKILSSIKIK